jgi:hypothetical protein
VFGALLLSSQDGNSAPNICIEPGKGIYVMSWGNPEATNVAPIVVGSPEWVAKRDVLLGKWESDKSVLAAAKASEAESRVAFADFAFPVQERKSGVNKIELNHGYTAKLGHVVNYKIVVPNATVESAEEVAPTLGNEAVFLFERIITWEAKFSVGEYKKLDLMSPEHAKVKQLVDTLIEVSNGMPSLEIVAPKAKLNG